MRMVVSSIIFIVILFIFSEGSIYAQTPVQLDKNITKEGVTSPLPSDHGSYPQQITTVNAVGKTGGSNYYPDERLSEKQTKLLLVFGLLSIFLGTLLVVGVPRVPITAYNRKKNLIIMSKHFGHNI